ncbi:hypothetical protein MKW92_043376 [Papaver armeniacum]|nr:hypothetical protein MKW92_043376 [Papaver armeniacum]
MPKIHGSADTYSYPFKRQRVSESIVSNSITLGDIQRDELTKLASGNWSKTTKDSNKPFDPELVKQIYESELSAKEDNKPVSLHRVMMLEVSQYLENYLWPNFDSETASFEHVMSVILMINEKFRENVAAWVCLSDKRYLFKSFLERVLRLKEQGRALTIAEKTNYLVFMINVFQSLENDIVSQTVLKLAGLRVWNCLSLGRLKMEMFHNPELQKKLGKMKKKESKLEVRFVKNLIEGFLEILNSQVFSLKQSDHEDSQLGGIEHVDSGCVLYCERFIEFLIDLLSQLGTRRFLRAVVADVAVIPKCHLSALYNHPKGRLFAQFEINDHTETQLSDDDVLLAHYSRIQLKELALANVGLIDKRADLVKILSMLSPEELQDLVCNKLELVHGLVFEKRQSQKEAINALPLYPNEQIMWDESLIPSVNYSGEGCLALPKLNLQFLTFHDYLLRNFNLFLLESTYEIREDIQEAIPHLLPYINVEGETAFRGWSRMGVPIKEFKIKEVQKPNIGEVKPASVTADVMFSISSYNAQIRSEWNSLKEHDVLFLLSIRPSFEPLSSEEAAKSSVPERLGIQFVRGCEVIEIRDEEGGFMNDFSGKIKRDEWKQKPPKGELRTVTVALDTAQYFMDVNAISGKGAQDVYGTFNILLRRKPKENNFKAVLEAIRDLMNESCTVPDWLHKIFLGYGDPSAAQWKNMPDLLDAVDFKRHVCFTGQTETKLHPEPPFRLKFPKTLKTSTPAQNLIVEAYVPPDPAPYPQDQSRKNSVRFICTQVEAIISGIQPGLTMVVGPPGTGKTDTAVQILNVLFHNCPSQRTLIITHSNQALNDLFGKIMQRDVPPELATDIDFSRQGRVNAMLVRRLELLSEVERLARSLQLPEDVGYTCETAGYFWLLHVYSRWEQFIAACAQNLDKPSFVKERFPFIFSGQSFEKDMRAAKGCFHHLQTMFQELEECRAFELLKSTADRANYLMTKQARLKDFLQLGFKYDNLLMEESAQILEIETLIPMLLQTQEDGCARLKRCILIGDHHQLPPVVKNVAFQKYSHMDQSLFTRFVRLGVPYIELNAQGRARPNIAKLYNWRYRDLGDLPICSTTWVYQNVREAEYIVSVYIYMRLLGYPASKISILTTYNGQKLLIRDVITRRCSDPLIVSRSAERLHLNCGFGHLRDVRRLIVAMSRARLGLYVFCCRSLFEQCYELQPTFNETTSVTDRDVGDTGKVHFVSGVEEMARIIDGKSLGY